MKITNLENYEGLFFVVQDEKKQISHSGGDTFEDFFTDFDEAIAEAEYQWQHMSDYDKARSRVSLLVSNTARWCDEFEELTSCEDEFVLPANTQERIDAFKMNSPDTARSLEWREKLLAEKKAQHKVEMEKRDKFLAQVKATSDAEKCIAWKQAGYSQPSGTEILRIKKETGLSWSEFKSFIENL